MLETDLKIEQLKETIIDCAIKVHRTLGPGLLESVCVVVEVKAVERYHSVHLAQLGTCLTLTGHPAGLLMNFNVTSLKFGLRRADHPVKQRSS